MNITSDATITKEAYPITNLLVKLGKTVLKDAKNAEWLDLDTATKLCRDHKITLNGQHAGRTELESALRDLFKISDEINTDGLNVVGYERRVGWDLIFMLRFYPDHHFKAVKA